MFPMDDAARSRWSWRLTVWGFIIALVGLPTAVYGGYEVFKHFDSNDGQIVAITCPRLFDKAHDLLEEQSSLTAPPLAGVSFTPSQDIPGRVDLSLTWINPVPISQSAIVIQGVYGQPGLHDDFIDQQQPAAATGECWNWYHFEPRDDAQPETVRLRVSGLWPEQRYCFYTVFRIDQGYSKPTTIHCETATWKSEWGTPAQAPEK
jgi:hypothetical protein